MKNKAKYVYELLQEIEKLEKDWKEQCLSLGQDIPKPQGLVDKQSEVVGLIYEYVHIELTQKLPRKYPQVVNYREGVPVPGRYQVTDLMHSFFAEVMTSAKVNFWKLRTPRELRAYSLTAVSNRIKTLLRQDKNRERIVNDLRAENSEVIVSAREKFRNEEISRLDDALALLDEWDRGPEQIALYARIVRAWTIGSMTLEEIANDLGTTKDVVFRQKNQAFELLRRNLNN